MIAPKSKPAVPLWRRLRTAPRLAEFTHADVRLDDFLSAETDELQALAGHGPVRALLLALADHSPFLWRLVTADPARLAKLLNASPEQSLADCLAQLMAICDEASSEAAIMRALRRAKQETALLILAAFGILLKSRRRCRKPPMSSLVARCASSCAKFTMPDG